MMICLKGMTSTVLLLLLLAGSLVVSGRRGGRDQSSAGGAQDDDEQCVLAMQHVYHDQVLAPNPPDLTGEWTSRRCEVRPGPEFLLRKYRFMENGQFELHQYYYADSDCHSPTYSVLARGSITLNDRSWLVLGAMESDYQLSYVSVRPYTEHMAELLGSKVNRTCPGFVGKQPWRPYVDHEIFHYVEFPSKRLRNEMARDQQDAAMQLHEDVVVVDRDCTSALHFTLNELQLVRLEVRRHHLLLHRTLYVGNVHTELTQRQSYRPTSYQPPLARREKPDLDHGCPVCRIIENSDDSYPPSLHRRSTGKHGGSRTSATSGNSLAGEWFSSRCEVRPIGTFMTRHLIFSVPTTTANNATWEGYYHHFGDEQCREPMFSIYARGSYNLGPQSLLVDGAFDVDIKVSRVHVTPRDDRILKRVTQGASKGTCGERGIHWEVGIERDVTPTGGCAELTLAVPMIELELAKLEHDHKKKLLLLGERPVITEDYVPRHQSRPTSFLPPLVKCTDRTELSLGSRADKVGYTIVERAGSGSDFIAASRVTCTVAAFLVNIVLGLWLQR